MVSKSFEKFRRNLELAHARLHPFYLVWTDGLDLIFGLEFGLREDWSGEDLNFDSFEILEYGLGEAVNTRSSR